MSQKKLKVDPGIFPAIILAAFVFGLVLALALGFSPQRSGGHGSGGHSLVPSIPGLVFVVEESGRL